MADQYIYDLRIIRTHIARDANGYALDTRLRNLEADAYYAREAANNGTGSEDDARQAEQAVMQERTVIIERCRVW